MSVTLLNPQGLPDVDVYRQVAIATGSRSVFIAGQVAVDRSGASVGVGDLAAQVNQVFAQAQVGLVDYGVLGATQIDLYGNINSTMVGDDYAHPKKRFPGSGGANEVASFCWKTIVIMMHEKRRFVPRVDFVSSPGYLDGTPQARERAGLPAGTGPWRVVTSKALLGFDEDTRRMTLLGVLEELSPEEVLAEIDAAERPRLLALNKLDLLDEPRRRELSHRYPRAVQISAERGEGLDDLREAVEARNQLDALVHATEKTLKENGDKVGAGEKADVEAAVAAARQAMEGQDADAIKAANDRLSQAAMKMGESLYKAQQAQAEQGGGEGAVVGAGVDVQEVEPRAQGAGGGGLAGGGAAVDQARHTDGAEIVAGQSEGRHKFEVFADPPGPYGGWTSNEIDVGPREG